MRTTSLIAFLAIASSVLFLSGCTVSGLADGTQDSPSDSVNSNDNSASAPDTAPPDAIITTASKWDLWSAGETRLRGVDLHPCALTEERENASVCVRHIDQQDIQDVRDLGANLVNASYPGIFNEQPPYDVNATNLQELDNVVEWVGNAGMYVVINIRSGPGRNEAAIQTALGWETLTEVWTDQDAHDAWIDMWRSIAERYGDNPVVVGYSLMVEPHVNTWLDPSGTLTPEEFDEQHRGTLGDWNAFAQEITEAIREIDTETPIIVESLNWAGASWFPALIPTTDPMTIYSLHAYEPDVYLAQDAGVSDITYPSVVVDEGDNVNFNADWLADVMQPAADFAAEHNVPIYIGEFGLFRWVPDGATFVADEIALFESLGWNHAFYVWRGDVIGFDAFNMEYGPDSNSTTIVEGNSLLTALTAGWLGNAYFPASRE